MRLLSFNALFIFLIVLENFFLFYTYKHKFLGVGQTKNATALFVSSLLFGILLLCKFYNKKTKTYPAHAKRLKKIFLPALALIPIVYIVYLLSEEFIRTPIHYKASDIIPTIQVLVRRFISGNYVYTPITEFGYYLPVTYLPMQWFPYTLPGILHFDYRWMAFAIWNVSALYLLARSTRLPWQKSILILVLLYGAYLCQVINYPDISTTTVEIMVAGYYILFIIGLNQNNAVLQGLFIAFCLLSRYSLVLWLPLWCFTMLISKDHKRLLIASLTILVFISVVYIIPFLSKDWSVLYNGYKTYDAAAHYEWIHLTDDGYPIHLYNGTGFAHLFFENLTTLPVMDRIRMLQKVHFMVCAGSLLLLGTWYYFSSRKLNSTIFLMSSFKIYITLFLAFIHIPYVYLTMVGSFVSIAIFAEQLGYTITNRVDANKKAIT